MRREGPYIHETAGKYTVFTRISPDDGSLRDSFVLIAYAEAPLGAGTKSRIPDASPYQLLAFRNDWIIKIASSVNNLILLPVRGPSMEKTIMDGDVVLVDRGRKEIIRDLIYAVRIEETLAIKRLQKLPDGRIRLISDNKDFPPEDFPPGEISIAGRVIWLGREHIK